MKATSALLALALAGCATATRLPADQGAQLDPVLFFTGRTQGEGVLHKAFGSQERVTVESFGRRTGDALLLIQDIRQGTGSTRRRQWLMRRIGANQYTGTLSDAEGPVEIQTFGARGVIRFRMKSGLHVEQRLALQADRKTLRNELTVRKFGIRVARLDETIRKLD